MRVYFCHWKFYASYLLSLSKIVHQNNHANHRRRDRGGGGGAPAPQSKMCVGGGGAGIPFRPPAFMAENPLFCEFLMIYFNYDFSLSLLLSLLLFFKLISYRPCCDFHPISVSLLFFLQIRCGNNSARHKLYAVKITATSVRIHWLLIRNLYWYSV